MLRERIGMLRLHSRTFVARQKCISNLDNRGTDRHGRNEHLKRHRSLPIGLKMSMKLDRLGSRRNLGHARQRSCSQRFASNGNSDPNPYRDIRSIRRNKQIEQIERIYPRLD